VLFIKRASNPSDAWSGNVAYPGGRRSLGDEDDLAVAIRETREEVGLDLSDASAWVLLGRLDDRPVSSKGRARAGFALCPFVFLQTVPRTPPLALQASEVAAARWVPVAALADPAGFDPAGVRMPFAFIPAVAALPAWLKRALGVDTAYFPTVHLPHRAGAGAEVAGAAAAAAGSGAELPGEAAVAPPASPTPTPAPLQQRVAQELASASPPPSFDSHDDPSQRFQLWGLTLQVTSELLVAGGMAPLNWPIIRLGGVANSWVYAVCGWVELVGWARGTRKAAHVRGKHVAWALAAAASPFLAGLAVAVGVGWVPVTAVPGYRTVAAQVRRLSV
jgi:8-oxo-dGTP pyrophosphatase MutT (NUDIX family)